MTSYNAILTASVAHVGQQINGSSANPVIITRVVIGHRLCQQFFTRDSRSSAQINRSASFGWIVGLGSCRRLVIPFRDIRSRTRGQAQTAR
jgi:hypothetical protein